MTPTEIYKKCMKDATKLWKDKRDKDIKSAAKRECKANYLSTKKPHKPRKPRKAAPPRKPRKPRKVAPPRKTRKIASRKPRKTKKSVSIGKRAFSLQLQAMRKGLKKHVIPKKSVSNGNGIQLQVMQKGLKHVPTFMDRLNELGITRTNLFVSIQKLQKLKPNSEEYITLAKVMDFKINEAINEIKALKLISSSEYMNELKKYESDFSDMLKEHKKLLKVLSIPAVFKLSDKELIKLSVDKPILVKPVIILKQSSLELKDAATAIKTVPKIIEPNKEIIANNLKALGSKLNILSQELNLLEKSESELSSDKYITKLAVLILEISFILDDIKVMRKLSSSDKFLILLNSKESMLNNIRKKLELKISRKEQEKVKFPISFTNIAKQQRQSVSLTGLKGLFKPKKKLPKSGYGFFSTTPEI